LATWGGLKSCLDFKSWQVIGGALLFNSLFTFCQWLVIAGLLLAVVFIFERLIFNFAVMKI